MNVLHEGLGDSKYRPCPLLKQYVAAGWLGKKSGRGFYDYAAASTGSGQASNPSRGSGQASNGTAQVRAAAERT
jgi:3-hydroxyacyl-CoA dehydrogenase